MQDIFVKRIRRNITPFSERGFFYGIKHMFILGRNYEIHFEYEIKQAEVGYFCLFI